MKENPSGLEYIFTGLLTVLMSIGFIHVIITIICGLFGLNRPY